MCCSLPLLIPAVLFLGCGSPGNDVAAAVTVYVLGGDRDDSH